MDLRSQMWSTEDLFVPALEMVEIMSFPRDSLYIRKKQGTYSIQVFNQVR